MTLQKLLSIQWIFLCVLDYVDSKHPSASPDASRSFLKNYLNDISALAISPQKIIELDESDDVEISGKRMNNPKYALV